MKMEAKKHLLQVMFMSANQAIKLRQSVMNLV
jgi:hypothetical protein